jgi:transposase InsO family protein
MPWKESSVMSERLEFIRLAAHESANIRQLCRRFEISPTTAYKWIARYRDALSSSPKEEEPSQPPQLLLLDRSRRPLHSPQRTPDEIEEIIIKLRKDHPSWGGRKLRRRLLDLGHSDNSLPSPSTITCILHRHQLIYREESEKRRQLTRFEHPYPNDLWQMDFKGEFALDEEYKNSSARKNFFCYPLTVLDDHSRFALALMACPSQASETVKEALTNVFRRYGLPKRMTMDNGSPWGTPRGPRSYTHLRVWLLRLGVSATHSRPHHPQTQGKDERFHRTLEAELLRPHRLDGFSQKRKNNRGRRPFPRLSPQNTLEAWQEEFDLWRLVYNCQRPHEAIGMQVPAQRYEPSPRSFPEVLPAIEYDSSDIVRRVQKRGFIVYMQQHYHVGHAFGGLDVALRHTAIDRQFDVYFCHQKIGKILSPR